MAEFEGDPAVGEKRKRVIRNGRERWEPTGNHAVGYGRPPPGTRFGDNNRANPNGRPKGSRRKKSPAELLHETAQEVFGELLTYTSNGKRRRSPSYRLLLESLRTAALKNDRHARRDMLKLLDSMRPGKFCIDEDFKNRQLSDEEARLVASHPDVVKWNEVKNNNNNNEYDFSVLDRDQRDQLRELLIIASGQNIGPDALAEEAEKRAGLRP